jgi:hypothetical protein
MATPNPRTTAKIADHPIHPMLIPFPVPFLVATFVSDVAFWRTGNPGWATASLWLLGAALIMGALAALAGLSRQDYAGSRDRRLDRLCRRGSGSRMADELSASPGRRPVRGRALARGRGRDGVAARPPGDAEHSAAGHGGAQCRPGLRRAVSAAGG